MSTLCIVSSKTPTKLPRCKDMHSTMESIYVLPPSINPMVALP